jgi:signal transduction histidine kinase
LDEIGQLARTMNQMLSRLEDSSRRERRFVADASHELRSPLAAIQTTLDVGLAYPERAPWPEIAARASEQSQRLAQLLEQLLVLAKSDEQTSASRRRDVDVDALLRDVVAGTLTDHVDITLNLAGDAVVSGDRVHLERVFRNVLENAVRYAATTVEVTTFTSATAVDIRIVDDGPGIAAADCERVFERFVRLDQSRDRTTGNSGLGLAIAREIIVAHHGTIWIDDAPGSGAHLAIRLPRR